MKSLGIAATGMLAQQTNIDVISNNIANLSTTSFKRQRASFVDLLYQNEKRVGVNAADDGTILPAGIQTGVGVKPAAVYRLNEQGGITETGNDLDVAINGRGYFQVDRPNGLPTFTRDGTFQVNQNGDLVTSTGFPVAPGITIPEDAIDVNINESGEVFAIIDDLTAPINLGQLTLVNFINEAGLDAIGNNEYQETEASGAPIIGLPGQEGFGLVLQRFLELSNVDAVTEITTLITAQRTYELNSRVISASDEMLQTVSQLR